MNISRIKAISIGAFAVGAVLAGASFAFAGSGPPAPTLISPANGSATTTAGQTSASWSTVNDAAGGITYVYQSANASTTNSDGSFASPVYTSGPLSTTTISTAGTPDGTYYWHVEATDSTAATSSWSTTWDFIVDNTPTPPATTTPVISNVNVSATATSSATISWTTDQAADSQVFYGTSANYSASTTLDSTASTTHAVMLDNLAAGTTYHFMVESSDGNGSATSSDATFTTAKNAPVISDITVSDIGTSSARVSWDSDQAADSQVFFGTTTAYSASTTLDMNATTTPSATLADLAAGTTYHFKVQSSNGNGTTSSSDHTFTTASSTSGGGGGGTGTSTPLAESGIDTNQGTATADGSFNDGWQWTFHFTVPTDESQFALSFGDFVETGNASSTIPAADNIRYYSAQSSNATSSDSAIVITAANQYPSTMLDFSGDATTSPDRDIEVVVQMAVPFNTPSGSYTGDWNAESTTTATTTP